MRGRCIISLAEAMSGSGLLTGEDDHTRFLERDRTDRGKLDRFALVKREVSRNLHLNDLDHDMKLLNPYRLTFQMIRLFHRI
jgi:hypothetical protein